MTATIAPPAAPPPAPTRAPLATRQRGLTSAEVAERVRRGETNNFKARVGRSYWDILRDNILNLFNIVLFTLLVVVLILGDYATVIFAGLSVTTNSLFGMIQEISAKRKLDQLAALSAPQVKVWRDGAIATLPVTAIVKDDVLPIEPGDKIVVDGQVLGSDSLEIDESQLTGESDAIFKNEGDRVLSGSFCIAGSGEMLATRVGKDSTVNQLSTQAKLYKKSVTPTQRKIELLVQITVVIMAISVPMIFLAGFLTYRGITLNVFRNAVVFVTSIVPQGLILASIISFTYGALVISRRNTLVQRVNAVESMGNVNIFCFDKTGTLTRNQLEVDEILPLNGHTQNEVHQQLQLYVANLAHRNRTAGAVAGYVADGGTPQLAAVNKLREVPFTSARKWGAVVLPNETFILGAPERVLPDDADQLRDQALEYASRGLRVLAFARTQALAEGDTLAEREPIALIVMSDQVREDMAATLQQFREQGVRLKVISGDNAETVAEICRQAGMDVTRAYTGQQLQAMNDLEFATAANEGDLFARIEPDTKKRLVAALRSGGNYVAMTGDGVNDVPALKEANLAVCMNDGAQISKDVADIVLLDNSLAMLPRAFDEGRTITQTVFGTSKVFLVKNLYSLLFFIFAGFMAMPFPINPIQISWVTFGVINIPTTLMALRFIKPAPMRRFRADVLDYVVNAGVVGAVSMCLLYAVSYLYHGEDVTRGRSGVLVFITLYGILTLWNVCGINLVVPRTIAAQPRLFILGIVLALITLFAPYIVPQFIEVVAPTPGEWLLNILVFALATLLVDIGIRTRGMVNRIWELTSP